MPSIATGPGFWRKKLHRKRNLFDLLICDLSFKKDHREEKIKSGKELIVILKSENPDLKVLVKSIEDHPQTVKELWSSGNIEAYVCKDRHGLKELKEAISHLNNGSNYNSPSIEKRLKELGRKGPKIPPSSIVTFYFN